MLTLEKQHIGYNFNCDNCVNSDRFSRSYNHPTVIEEATPQNIQHDLNFGMKDPIYTQ